MALNPRRGPAPDNSMLFLFLVAFGAALLGAVAHMSYIGNPTHDDEMAALQREIQTLELRLALLKDSTQKLNKDSEDIQGLLDTQKALRDQLRDVLTQKAASAEADRRLRERRQSFPQPDRRPRNQAPAPQPSAPKPVAPVSSKAPDASTEWCRQMQREHNVVIGSSWGTLPARDWGKWTDYNCDNKV